MKKALIVALASVALAVPALLADSWGRKASAIVTSTELVPSNYVAHVSFYNAGTTDVSVAVNVGVSTFDLAFTNNSLPIIASLCTLTLDYSAYAPSSIGLQRVTNIMIRSASGTQTVYVAGY